MDERIERAVLTFEEACHQSGHSLCHDSRSCEAGLAALGAERAREATSQAFDAGREILDREHQMPGHDWPTATLICFVHHQLHRQPNVRGLWRATAITTALARLAERGLPADCLVRTCVGPTLLRHILTTASAQLALTRTGGRDRALLPDLEAWFQLLESDGRLASGGVTDAGFMCTTAMTGDIHGAAEDWLASASIAHVLGWRLDDYLKVERHIDDLTIGSGASAARWIYERSVFTYPAEWRSESRAWEAAFIAEPEAVAVAAGVHRSLLEERIVTQDSLIRAQRDLVLGRATASLVDGMQGSEVVETVVSLLESGAVSDARSLARRAHLAHPADDQFRLSYAFCTIPSQPDEAESVLAGLSPEMARRSVVQLDRAAIRLMRGVPLNPESVLGSIDADDLDSGSWLWDPCSLPDSPHVIFASARQWVERLRAR